MNMPCCSSFLFFFKRALNRISLFFVLVISVLVSLWLVLRWTRLAHPAHTHSDIFGSDVCLFVCVCMYVCVRALVCLFFFSGVLACVTNARTTFHAFRSFLKK
ncbi:hypothetical protein, unlikely [Trypanosoma brucei gambiense DAL972]|uniref:Uncharacterized protein n=1 Tax=Trypanosoma brucei gambiense (strain MHOM/CI/86/DAL972) TaxID=679716 RepID=D0A584_TRYB9|nr:hypothetical protein, unlikely [Trypanosoma brucei gambiense DAL972]CBH16428.1 hypothetical protein, unlikely [Trypanosoma brucei gambiense DAL972]|eukprot:XP_011778692.1 hypothetical protein, unlikely [Trypanosoma brucei gambiense DAL972]